MAKEEVTREQAQAMLLSLNQAYHEYHDGRTQDTRIAARKSLNSSLKWFQGHRIGIQLVRGPKPHYELVKSTDVL